MKQNIRHRWQVLLRPGFVVLFTVQCLGSLILPAQTNQWVDSFPAAYAGRPFHGQPLPIPGVIQAEDYDLAPAGANDVSFHYLGQPRSGDLRPAGDAIALARFGPGHVTTNGLPEKPDQVYVGWTEDGQWMKYTVRVAESGIYRIGGHFAAAGTNATLSFSFNPDLATKPLILPTTAGYQPGVEVYHVWETLDHLTDITLPAGTYVMTVTIQKAGGMNLDYFTFNKEP